MINSLDREIETTLNQIRTVSELLYRPMQPIDVAGNIDPNKAVLFMWYNNNAKRSYELLIKRLSILAEAKVDSVIAIDLKEKPHESE